MSHTIATGARRGGATQVSGIAEFPSASDPLDGVEPLVDATPVEPGPRSADRVRLPAAPLSIVYQPPRPVNTTMTDDITNELASIDAVLGDDVDKDAFDEAPEWAMALINRVEANARVLDELEERREAALQELGAEMAAQAKRNRARIEYLARETGVDTIEPGDGHPSKNGHATFEKYDTTWGATLGLGR